VEDGGVTEGSDLRLGDGSLYQDPVHDLHLSVVKVEIRGEENGEGGFPAIHLSKLGILGRSYEEQFGLLKSLVEVGEIGSLGFLNMKSYIICEVVVGDDGLGREDHRGMFGVLLPLKTYPEVSPRGHLLILFFEIFIFNGPQEVGNLGVIALNLGEKELSFQHLGDHIHTGNRVVMKTVGGGVPGVTQDVPLRRE
jgi:hypothetical protein